MVLYEGHPRNPEGKTTIVTEIVAMALKHYSEALRALKQKNN